MTKIVDSVLKSGGDVATKSDWKTMDRKPYKQHRKKGGNWCQMDGSDILNEWNGNELQSVEENKVRKYKLHRKELTI